MPQRTWRDCYDGTKKTELTEKEIRGQVVDYLRTTGWFVWLDRQTLTKPGYGTFHKSKGVSDVLALKNGRFLAVEIKRPGKRLTEEQDTFLWNIREHGGIGIMASGIEDLIGVI